MTAIRWMSGVLAAALRRQGPTRSQLCGRIRFLEQARDAMRDTIRSVEQERDGLRARIVSLRGPRQPHRQELIRIAQQLRRWSDESHAGGWSTQQCKPMEALAKEIYQHIGEGVSYELMLRRVGRQLAKWADESLTGGWSIHQTKPMRALAAEIDAHIGAHCQDPSRSTLEESGAEPAAAWLPSERQMYALLASAHGGAANFPETVGVRAGLRNIREMIRTTAAQPRPESGLSPWGSRYEVKTVGPGPSTGPR